MVSTLSSRNASYQISFHRDSYPKAMQLNATQDGYSLPTETRKPPQGRIHFPEDLSSKRTTSRDVSVHTRPIQQRILTCCNRFIPFFNMYKVDSDAFSPSPTCPTVETRASSALVETTHWANARLDLQRQRVFEVGEFFFLVLASSKVLE